MLQAANNSCETCGRPVKDGKGMVCDEMWHYTEGRGYGAALLVALRMLCLQCDRARHPGMAGVMNSKFPIYEHMMRVNGWTRRKTETVVEEAWRDFRRRSEMTWAVEVEPGLVRRWPALVVLNGQVGEPGDGTRRVAMARAARPARRSVGGTQANRSQR
jgi:hypothetical protein